MAASGVIKVAHFIDGLGSGGAEALLVTNLQWFGGLPFEHIVVTLFAENSPAYPPAHFWAGQIRELGVPVLNLGVREKADLPRATNLLRRLLVREGVSITHTHLLWAGLTGRMAARLAGIPVVSSLHIPAYEPEVLAGYRSPHGVKHSVMRVLEAVSLRQADAVIAVGAAVLRSALDRLRVPPQRAHVILNPVNFAGLDKAPLVGRDTLLAELGLATDARLLVNVGRLVPQKNQLGLLEELAPLLRGDSRLSVVMLGAQTDGSYTGALKRQVANLRVDRQVHLLGERRDVASWLAAAELFVFPSAYEGLPVALIEAAAVGCACVASDIAPNREILEGGVSGLLPPLGVSGAFRRAVATLLSDPDKARRMGAQAKTTTRSRFTPEASVDALGQLYTQVVVSGGQSR